MKIDKDIQTQYKTDLTIPISYHYDVISTDKIKINASYSNYDENKPSIQCVS